MMLEAEAMAMADQLDLEAAEQLIQLSGGDGAGDDGAVAEDSRSADSVECGGGAAGQEAGSGGRDVKGKEESRGRVLADKAGGGGDAGKSAGSSAACSRPGPAGVEEDQAVKDKESVVESRRVVRSPRRRPVVDDCAAADGVGGGEPRKRPRFRSLAAVYRETDAHQIGGSQQRHADQDPPEDERRGRNKKKRAADEVMPATPSNERRAV